MARCLRLERLLAELSPGSSEPQPTTVSHDGGLADRAGARVPRCTPAGLSHVVRHRSEQVSTADAMGRTLRDDLFVPKQLGWAPDLGLVCLSPAGMVHECAWLFAAVRLRCHAVRHSPWRRSGRGLLPFRRARRPPTSLSLLTLRVLFPECC